MATEFPTITIPEMLVRTAETADETRGYTFVADDGKSEEYYSFAKLAQTVARYAKAFRRLGLVPGDRLVLAIPGSEHFTLSFLGAMHAGLTPVPIYPPMSLGKLGNYLEHSRHIIEKAQSRVLVTTNQIRQVMGSLLGSTLDQIATVSELPLDDEEESLVRRPLDAPGFIQFTSGSTSRPKGVVLTLGNLAANAHCIMNLGLKATPEDRGCTWLPFYHDMGLIGFVLSPLYTATPVAFIPPLLFLKRPAEWLRLISKHRGSISFGPNFAYGLATKRVRDSQLEGVDLSSWRIAGCGAEPIQLDTLMEFARRYEDYGFDRRAFMPSYGMAESTLAISFYSTTEVPRADRIGLDDLSSEGKATPIADEGAGSSAEVAHVVDCGRPFEGHEIAIVNDSGEPVGDRRVGEIVVRGPSVTTGYFNDPEATSQAIRDGWLHTGDLGYMADGSLHICGRIKDLIIIAGKNYYPTDLEWAASEVDGVRKGNVVAFGVAPVGGGRELVVIAAETKLDEPDWPALRQRIEGRLTAATGVRPDEVVVLAAGALPKTSSGKLQRAKAKQLYALGELDSAHKGESKLGLVKHLARSQWGLLTARVRGGGKRDANPTSNNPPGSGR